MDNFSDVYGLDGVVSGILSLKDSEIYKKLVLGTPDNPLMDSGDYDEPSLIAKLAGKNMSKFPLRIPGAPLIGAKEILVVYTFIHDLYSIYANRELNADELGALFYGDLAARVLLLTDDFDSTMETPQPTGEFFKQLGKVKWENKRVKKLYNEFSELYFMLIFNNKLDKEVEGTGSAFRTTQKAFLRLLAGCYAVNNRRKRIIAEDIVRANQLYLKLIHTDLTNLMEE